MAEPATRPPLAPHQERLRQHIEAAWRERDRFVREGGDPDAELDQFAEEFFATPEATQVLLDYLDHTVNGPDPDAEEDSDDDGW